MRIDVTEFESEVVISLLENALNGWEGDQNRQDAAQRVINTLQAATDISFRETFCFCPGKQHPARTHCLICLKPYPVSR